MNDKTPTVILGIDPGTKTGIARYEREQLVELDTIKPWQLGDLLQAHAPTMVIFEDSRLQSYTWTSAGSKGAAAKLARNVGEIDAWCKLIEAECEKRRIKAIGVSPANKGRKTTAAEFERITSWSKPTNEHTRDAAMVAWPYRRARPLL